MAAARSNRSGPGRGRSRPSSWRGARRIRLADPRFYLGAIMVVAAAGLVVMPVVADAFIATARPASDTTGTCRIYQVIDGDTVRMWCPGRYSTKARLTGFDAPELFSPACASELLAAQQAQWALRRAIFGATRIVLSREGVDRYGRALVAVTLDGEPLARKMIAAGHARPYAGGRRQGWCT